VIVRFVDIGGIVNHHFSNVNDSVLFLMLTGEFISQSILLMLKDLNVCAFEMEKHKSKSTKHKKLMNFAFIIGLYFMFCIHLKEHRFGL
jgi:Ni/Fe-hydrogenase subunit HybB-like protein